MNRVLIAAKELFENRRFLAGFILLLAISLLVLSPYIFSIPFPFWGTYPINLPMSAEHPLGTDSLGRDLLAVLVHSVGTSLELGLLAGGIAVLIAVAVGFTSGYIGGLPDHTLRSVTDVILVIPLWPLLVLISTMVRTLSIPIMAALLGVFAWPGAARSIRAQVLSLKEREFINISKLCGRGSFGIMFMEIFPNTIPYVAMGYVNSTMYAILAEVSLEVIGLGPQNVTSIGLMLFWAQQFSAAAKGWWWWLFPPISILFMIFLGLYLMGIGLDEIGNPRLRTE